MKTVFLFFTILAALILSGCKPKETTLSGQIFIVTRGSENIKLGLVEVQLIERQQVSQFLQMLQPAIDSEIADLKNKNVQASIAFGKARADFELLSSNLDCDALKARYETLTDEHAAYMRQTLAQGDQLDAAQRDFFEAKHSFETASGSLRSYYQEVALQKSHIMGDLARARTAWLNENAPAMQAKDQEAAQLLQKLDQIKPLAEKLQAAKERQQECAAKANGTSYPQAKTYFADFPPFVNLKVLTDADGKFSFSYPRDKLFSIFAKAERAVGEKKETYYWLINAPSDEKPAQILLSNNNLVFSDPDGYFKIKPQPEGLSQVTP